MVSRYTADDDPKKVAMIYTESFSVFRSITEENLKKYGIDLTVDFQPSKDPPGGSDHRSFVQVRNTCYEIQTRTQGGISYSG